MKLKLLILIFMFSLTGCVGLTYSGNSAVNTNDTIVITDLRYRDKKPPQPAIAIKDDGSETYVIENKREWCGLTVMAVVPIPLWLPVCRYYQEVTYKNEKIINVTSQHLTHFVAFCGPLVPLLTMWGGHYNFCAYQNSQ